MIADLTDSSASHYVRTISLDERRRNGTVYTPQALVRFILDQAGCTLDELDDTPVLDPACGAAVFLCEVLKRAAIRIGRGRLPLAGSERRLLIRFATQNLFGIDIDPQARLLALDALRARLQHLAPGPLAPDFMANNIIEDDFLTGDAVRRLRPIRRGGFAYVVGNPPYVATTRLPTAYKVQLRTMLRRHLDASTSTPCSSNVRSNCFAPMACSRSSRPTSFSPARPPAACDPSLQSMAVCVGSPPSDLTRYSPVMPSYRA
jgi:hypothetical protein